MNKLQLILLMIASVVIIAAALQLISQPAYAVDNKLCCGCICDCSHPTYQPLSKVVRFIEPLFNLNHEMKRICFF